MAACLRWARRSSGRARWPGLTHLEALGIDFIAEMLDRSDIRGDAQIHEVLTDYEAVRLAEELGMFGSTLGLRLRQNLELVAHFTHRPADAAEDEMMPEEALGVLRTCVQTVLGQDNLEVAVEFAAFRDRLEQSILEDDAPEIDALASSPYFYQRTVLRILLAGSKSTRGARLENVLANLNTLLPSIWPDLKSPTAIWSVAHMRNCMPRDYRCLQTAFDPLYSRSPASTTCPKVFGRKHSSRRQPNCRQLTSIGTTSTTSPVRCEPLPSLDHRSPGPRSISA